MRIKSTRLVNADKFAWDRIRNKFPGMSDSKRTKLIDILLDDTVSNDLINKLRPEMTDSKHDKIMKKIIKEMLGK